MSIQKHITNFFRGIFKRPTPPLCGITLAEIRRLQAGNRTSWLSRPASWRDDDTRETSMYDNTRIAQKIRQMERDK
jgi:hypothetical protein